MRSESVMNTSKSTAWTKKRKAEIEKSLSAFDAAEKRDIARDAWRMRPPPFNACPVCRSSQVRYAKKLDVFACRRCGHEWARPPEEAKKRVKK